MSSTQHQLIEQCAIRLRGIVEALDNIHDSTQHRSPHRWSTDLDDVHSSAESLLALIKDQAPALDAQDLALRTIAEYPCPEQDNMTAANMRQVAADAITGALAFGAQASRPPPADHWLRPFYDIGRAEGQRTQELAMLVRMLASSLKRHAPESNLVARATNYLAAKGLADAALAKPSPDAQYADDIAADLERSDWTPEDALRWYAAGKHFDTVNGRTRIIDTGAVASNALKHLSLPYLEMKGDAELTELREAMAQPSPAPELELLRSALSHIIKTCGQSRTETRRLRWIAQRAQWALDGKPYDISAFDLPKYSATAKERLEREVKVLREYARGLPAPVAQAQHSVPDVCDSKEQNAFEEWASKEGMNMERHPLHWLFLDAKTYSARQGWKAALKYARNMLAAAPVCRLSRSALTEAQMRRLYENSTETENERLGFEAFARLIRRAEAVHQIAAAPAQGGE
ncbi:TPA: hypothetical protein ACQTY9_001449 [Pseudomonas aeruginosa]